jgi:hypothetical protein
MTVEPNSSKAKTPGRQSLRGEVSILDICWGGLCWLYKVVVRISYSLKLAYVDIKQESTLRLSTRLAQSLISGNQIIAVRSSASFLVLCQMSPLYHTVGLDTSENDAR